MELTLAQCARCRRVYPRVRSAVCPDCEADEDADLARIRKVLEEHSDLTPEGVAEKAEVSLDCVFRLLDEGRVTNAVQPEERRCERCGSPSVQRGRRMCQACVIKLDAQFSKAVSTTRRNKRARDEEARGVHRTVEQKRRTPPKRTLRNFWQRNRPPQDDENA